MLRTGHMKSSITVWLVALDRGAAVLFLTNVTLQRPARLGHITQAIDWLQEDGILETDLGNPQGTDYMTPLVVYCLFKCTKQIGTERIS